MATNIDIVRTGYESLGRGDIQTTRAMFAEDIECRGQGGGGSPSGPLRGRDQVLRRVFAPVPESHDALVLQPLDFYADGDNVIVIGVLRMTDGGGIVADVPFAHVCTVREGRIDSLRTYSGAHRMAALHEGLLAA